MKLLVLLSIVMLSVFGANAQAGFFKPKPLPNVSDIKFKATPSGDTVISIVKNFVRPIVDVTATVSTGASLAGGVGLSWQHDSFDIASNSWVIKYSVSAVGFIGTNGTKITGLGGLIFGIPGMGGLVQVGPGYDFTQKQIVLLTGVGINF